MFTSFFVVLSSVVGCCMTREVGMAIVRSNRPAVVRQSVRVEMLVPRVDIGNDYQIRAPFIIDRSDGNSFLR